MPVCEALYSKALKVLPDAPLYSNRSAVRLALGRFDDAFEDATKATQTDSSYAKGYYRLGQAGEKCGKFSEARRPTRKGNPRARIESMALVLTQAGEGETGLRGEAEEEDGSGSGSPRTENRPTHPGEGQGEHQVQRQFHARLQGRLARSQDDLLQQRT